MRSDERPATRTLVRWNDDLDKSILLFINFACAEAGIKIPFGRVAELMGPRFSEGAIVQHIAKVRSKMQDEKEKTNPDLLVPPPNKRGSVTKPASAMCYANSRQRKTCDFSDPFYESNIKSKRGKVKRELEEDDDDRDPDYEWGSREISSVKKSKKIPGRQKQDILTLRYSGVKSVAHDDSEDSCSPTSTPARPRRTIKVNNYASIVDGVSDYQESSTEDVIHGETSKPGRNTQLSSRKPLHSGKENSPNLCTLQRSPNFPTTVAMDSTTPDMPNAGLMPSLGNSIGGIGGLPLLPQQYELNPFTDFNFNASGFSSNSGFALGMPTDIPAHGYGGLNHGLGGQRTSILPPLTPILQATTSNNSFTALTPGTIPMVNPTGASNTLPGYDDSLVLDSTNWGSMNPFEDEKLPSPNYSDFLDFDHNSVA